MYELFQEIIDHGVYIVGLQPNTVNPCRGCLVACTVEEIAEASKHLCVRTVVPGAKEWLELPLWWSYAWRRRHLDDMQLSRQLFKGLWILWYVAALIGYQIAKGVLDLHPLQQLESSSEIAILMRE